MTDDGKVTRIGPNPKDIKNTPFSKHYNPNLDEDFRLLPHGMAVHHKNQWDDYSGPDYHYNLQQAIDCESEGHVVVIKLQELRWLLETIGEEHGMSEQDVWFWMRTETRD